MAELTPQQAADVAKIIDNAKEDVKVIEANGWSDVLFRPTTWAHVVTFLIFVAGLFAAGGGAVIGVQSFMASPKVKEDPIPPAPTPVPANDLLVAIQSLAKVTEGGFITLDTNSGKRIAAMQARMEELAKEAVPVDPVPPGPAPTPGPTPSKQNPIVISVPSVVPVGAMSKVSAKSLGAFQWLYPPSSMTPTFDMHDAGSVLLVTPKNDGEVIIGAACVVDGKVWQTWAKVVAGNGPMPPPVPVPVPVPIIDPFQQAIQTAYERDGKSAKIVLLAAIYRQSATIVDSQDVKTPADIFTSMRKSIGTVLGEPDLTKTTVLPNVRKAIAAELDKSLPLGDSSVQPITDATRSLISAQFLRVKSALEGVK